MNAMMIYNFVLVSLLLGGLLLGRSYNPCR